MKTIHMVITNYEDGSNDILWATDPLVIDKMKSLSYYYGDERYASVDGLQVRTIEFNDDFNIEEWIQMNYILVTTLEDLE